MESKSRRRQVSLMLAIIDLQVSEGPAITAMVFLVQYPL